MTERRVGKAVKQRVVDRARGLCEYCRSPMRYCVSPFSVEHIQPRTKGGLSGFSNLALSCLGCNSHKYTKTEAPDPVTGKSTPLFHPRRQRWIEHFSWSADYSLILGQTPVGRATVEALQLNREGQVNLRRLLYESGLHPPSEE